MHQLGAAGAGGFRQCEAAARGAVEVEERVARASLDARRRRRSAPLGTAVPSSAHSTDHPRALLTNVLTDGSTVSWAETAERCEIQLREFGEHELFVICVGCSVGRWRLWQQCTREWVYIASVAGRWQLERGLQLDRLRSLAPVLLRGYSECCELQECERALTLLAAADRDCSNPLLARFCTMLYSSTTPAADEQRALLRRPPAAALVAVAAAAVRAAADVADRVAAAAAAIRVAFADEVVGREYVEQRQHAGRACILGASDDVVIRERAIASLYSRAAKQHEAVRTREADVRRVTHGAWLSLLDLVRERERRAGVCLEVPARLLVQSHYAAASAQFKPLMRASLVVSLSAEWLRLCGQHSRGQLRSHRLMCRLGRQEWEKALMKDAFRASVGAWVAAEIRKLVADEACARADVLTVEAGRRDAVGRGWRDGVRRAEARLRARQEFDAFCRREHERHERGAERRRELQAAVEAQDAARRRTLEAQAAARRERAKAFLDELQRQERSRQLRSVLWRGRGGERRTASPPARFAGSPFRLSGEIAALADPVVDTLHRVAAQCLVRGAARAGRAGGGPRLARMHRAVAGGSGLWRSHSQPLHPPGPAHEADERREVMDEWLLGRGEATASEAAERHAIARVSEVQLLRMERLQAAELAERVDALENRGREVLLHDESSMRSVHAERLAVVLRSSAADAADSGGEYRTAARFAQSLAFESIDQAVGSLSGQPAADREAARLRAQERELERRRTEARRRKDIERVRRNSALLAAEAEKVRAALRTRPSRDLAAESRIGFEALWKRFAALDEEERQGRIQAALYSAAADLAQAETAARRAVEDREEGLRVRAAELLILEGAASLPGDNVFKLKLDARTRARRQEQELGAMMWRLRNPGKARMGQPPPPSVVLQQQHLAASRAAPDATSMLHIPRTLARRQAACRDESRLLLCSEERVARVGHEKREEERLVSLLQLCREEGRAARGRATAKQTDAARVRYSEWRAAEQERVRVEKEASREEAARAYDIRMRVATLAVQRMQRAVRCHQARLRYRAELRTFGEASVVSRLETCMRRNMEHAEMRDRHGLDAISAAIAPRRAARLRAAAPGALEGMEPHIRGSLVREESDARAWCVDRCRRGAALLRIRTECEEGNRALAVAAAVAVQKVVRGYLARRSAPERRRVLEACAVHRKLHSVERRSVIDSEQYARFGVADRAQAALCALHERAVSVGRAVVRLIQAAETVQRGWRVYRAAVVARRRRLSRTARRYQELYDAQIEALQPPSRRPRPASAALREGPPPGLASKSRPHSAGATRSRQQRQCENSTQALSTEDLSGFSDSDG